MSNKRQFIEKIAELIETKEKSLSKARRADSDFHEKHGNVSPHIGRVGVPVLKSEKYKKIMKSLKKQSLSKVNEDIVAGVKVPKEIRGIDKPIPRDHPHRELASKFVTDVHRRDKAEGRRMSEKVLGIGEGGKPVEAQTGKQYSTIKSERSKELAKKLKKMVTQGGGLTLSEGKKGKPTDKALAASEPKIGRDIKTNTNEINRVDNTKPKYSQSPNWYNSRKSEKEMDKAKVDKQFPADLRNWARQKRRGAPPVKPKEPNPKDPILGQGDPYKKKPGSY